MATTYYQPGVYIQETDAPRNQRNLSANGYTGFYRLYGHG